MDHARESGILWSSWSRDILRACSFSRISLASVGRGRSGPIRALGSRLDDRKAAIDRDQRTRGAAACSCARGGPRRRRSGGRRPADPHSRGSAIVPTRDRTGRQPAREQLRAGDHFRAIGLRGARSFRRLRPRFGAPVGARRGRLARSRWLRGRLLARRRCLRPRLRPRRGSGLACGRRVVGHLDAEDARERVAVEWAAR